MVGLTSTAPSTANPATAPEKDSPSTLAPASTGACVDRLANVIMEDDVSNEPESLRDKLGRAQMHQINAGLHQPGSISFGPNPTPGDGLLPLGTLIIESSKWKAAYEEEARKFQAETLLTSALQAKADALIPLITDNARLESDNARLREALEYMADEAHWVDPDALLHRPGGGGRQGIYSWSSEVKGWAFSKTALGKTPMAIAAHRFKNAGEKPL